MRGLDTNVLVRFLLRDDQEQAQVAKVVIEQAVASGEPLLVSLLTILEAEWVLRSRAAYDKQAIIRVFKLLLEAKDVLFEHEETLEQALHQFENSSADFADCLMVARYLRMGCTSMLTFDANAAKLPGCELLK